MVLLIGKMGLHHFLFLIEKIRIYGTKIRKNRYNKSKKDTDQTE